MSDSTPRKIRIRPAAIIVAIVLVGLTVWSFVTPTPSTWRFIVTFLLYAFAMVLVNNVEEPDPAREKSQIWPIRTRSLILILVNVAIWSFALGIDIPMPWNIVGALALAVLLWLLLPAFESLVVAAPQRE